MKTCRLLAPLFPWSPLDHELGTRACGLAQATLHPCTSEATEQSRAAFGDLGPTLDPAAECGLEHVQEAGMNKGRGSLGVPWPPASVKREARSGRSLWDSGCETTEPAVLFPAPFTRLAFPSPPAHASPQSWPLPPDGTSTCRSSASQLSPRAQGPLNCCRNLAQGTPRLKSLSPSWSQEVDLFHLFQWLSARWKETSSPAHK